MFDAKIRDSRNFWRENFEYEAFLASFFFWDALTSDNRESDCPSYGASIYDIHKILGFFDPLLT